MEKQNSVKMEIGSINDLIRAKDIMIKTQSNVEITQVSELGYTIKLDGGRFRDFDLDYINADIAKIILDYQTQYNIFIDGLEQKFNIQIPQSQRMLKFKLDRGCIELSADLTELIKVGVSNMTGWQTMLVFIVAIAGWYARSSYHKYVEKEIKKIELERKKLDAEKEIKSKEIEREKLNDVLENVRKLVLDSGLQAPANHLKKSVASVLQDDEKAFIAPQIEAQADQPLTSADKDKFRVVTPPEEEVQDIEEEIDDLFYVEAQRFTDGKPLNLSSGALKITANSETTTKKKRDQILRKAERREPIRLKVKIIKDERTQKIKRAYIMSVIE